MSQDDKVFNIYNNMFELLGNLGRMAYRMDGFGRDTYYTSSIHEIDMTRLRLLEYKSIDMESSVR